MGQHCAKVDVQIQPNVNTNINIQQVPKSLVSNSEKESLKVNNGRLNQETGT